MCVSGKGMVPARWMTEMHIKIETDRGYGWQVRQEGTMEGIAAQALHDHTERCALNGPARLLVDGVVTFECPKLTTKRARALGMLG